MLSTNPVRTDRTFAILASLGTVLAFVAYRYAVGAGLGLDAGSNASGILEYPEDNFAYVAYLEQMRAGVFPFVNPFAGAMEQDGIYANPLFFVLGQIAAWTGGSAAGVLVCAGLLAAGITVHTVHALCEEAGLGRTTARLAAILTACGSGVSAIVALLSGPGGDAWIGVDRTHQDAIAFSTFAVYPFQSITLALLALWIRALVRRRRVAIAVWGAASALTRPYEAILALATFGVFACFSPRGDVRRRVGIAALAALTIAPGIAYGYWVSRQPAWLEYSEITISELAIDRRAWLTGYGLFLPAAVVGASVRKNDGESGTRNWFALWVGTLLILLVVVGIDQVKLASGAQIPLTILAAHGCAAWVELAATRSTRTLRRMFAAAGLVLALGFVFTTAHLLANVYRPHELPPGLRTVAAAVRDGRREALPLVLCDREVGTLLPGLVGCRVHAGHWSMTPARGERVDDLFTAGIDADPYGLRRTESGTPTRSAFDDLVARLDPAFVLLDENAAAIDFVSARPRFHEHTRSGQWILYEIR